MPQSDDSVSLRQLSPDAGAAWRIHALVEAQVALRPDAKAITMDGASLTYAELNGRANQLAWHLRGMGIGDGALVAIALERSIDMVVGLLAILKSGAAYLPLDLAYPKERVSFVLEDAAPAAMLTSAASIDRLPALGDLPVLLLDDPAPAWLRESVENPPATGGADPLAYVIYTSGSTGRPKGCLVTHGNVLQLLIGTEPWFGFGPRDVWSFFHSHAFDFSVWEIWGALAYGGRVVVVPYLTSRAPREFLNLLSREGVTVLNQTPSAFQGLVMALEDWDGPLALRYVIFGGESLELQSLRPWFDRFGDRQPQLINMYGITETTVFVTYRPVSLSDLEARRGSVIGDPIPGWDLWLLDEQQRPVAQGEVGEICVGGVGVCLGYLNRPDLNAARFLDWTPPGAAQPVRLYRSGDLARYLPDGDLEYLGRMDQQVKIRGFRIETGEIEAQILKWPGVRACAVVARSDGPGSEAQLVAYLVPPAPELHHGLREFLLQRLPDYMCPVAFVGMDALPLTENGKLDKRALPAPMRQRPDTAGPYQAPRGAMEEAICGVFARLLGMAEIGREDNFFEFGGNSLLAMRAVKTLREEQGVTLPVPVLFEQPTAAGLAQALAAGGTSALAAPAATPAATAGDIAIIAMSGRFPGAATVETFWENLRQGVESVERFDESSVDPMVPASLRKDPDYVWVRGVLKQVEEFDPAFFGIGEREAEVMDPQQRLLLELAWECLERAGHAPNRCEAPVGVFAGVYTGLFGNSYAQRILNRCPEVVEQVGEFQVMLANDKDYVATRIAHRLNLRGPAVSVQTACSTSLVAIAEAVGALRLGRCRMALAGGAAVTVPWRAGYLYQEGAMLSKDGHTRSFDADAGGTIFSDGAAMVLLKRLEDALADGDPVCAVIRGAAINNDGGGKASFTAPSPEGQAAVIRAAMEDARVQPRDISYVEAHGTATPLGDPVEVEGLARAFQAAGLPAGACRLGSAKSNVGHTVTAAGATGVIKTALSLMHEELPATLHYRAPNPAIDFARTPFVVNQERSAWPRRAGLPRRAGVSSFGVGGTNAHVVLEEAPLRAPSSPAVGPQLLLLSARSKTALETMAASLADNLSQARAPVNLADVAHTLQVGRARFSHRMCVVASSVEEAVIGLRTADAPGRSVRMLGRQVPQLVWLFPGQGAQYEGMGRALYDAEPVFRAALDRCFEALRGTVDFDLKDRMFQGGAEVLRHTAVTQPAMFCLEYGLAQLWLARGLRPAALIGHSVGEFVCAVLAGVMTLEDAVRLVARRGVMMQALPGGAMLSVRLSAQDVTARLPPGLALAADNGPQATVVAGPAEAIEAWRQQLESAGVVSRALQTSHAFHSPMMDAVVAPFEAEVRAVRMAAPQLPIYSTLTGAALESHQATDPSYWSRHLRDTVRFSPALRAAQEGLGDVAFLEMGPRGTLATLARQHQRPAQMPPVAVACLADQPQTEEASLALAWGQLWTLGIEPTLSVARPAADRQRLVLPTYPFERRRIWLTPSSPEASPPPRAEAMPTPVAATPSPVLSAIPVGSLPMAVAASPTDRRPQLLLRLRSVFEDVAGIDLTDADTDLGFVELGLDSLTLTQAALQIKKTFKVSLTFRQLMENYRSLDALTAFLDQTLPPEAAPAPEGVRLAAASPDAAVPAGLAVQPLALPVASVATAAFSASQPLVQQVIQQQMQLMAQQLALLQGGAVQAPGGGQPAASLSSAPAANLASPAATPQSTAGVPAAGDGSDEAEAVRRYDVKKAFGAIARIHTQHSELTERQQARLQAFIQRYTERTARSKQYTENHRAHLADPRVVNGFRPMTKEITYQIVIERSKGAHLWDLDGNEYVDVLNGFGMNLFGWQPDFVNDAVRRQLDLGYEIGPQHPLAGEVAQLVCELTGFDRAGLCNTGSEAVMAAVRIARTVTGRNTVVLFTGSYHGTFDEVLVRAGKAAKGLPAAPGIMSGVFGDVRVLDYGTPEALAFIRANAEDLAAVLVEPVQSRRPDFAPLDFLREVRAITEASGTCLIFDEVITGFRAHLGGTQAMFGIRADLASYGKVIGGGFPIGVIAGKRDYMDALDGGAWQYGDESMPTVGVTYFAGTFVRHPLALAAAKAALQHLKDSGPALQEQLNRTTQALADDLNAYCKQVGAPVAVRNFASLWRVSWLEDHPLQDLLFAMMRSRGIHILDNFPCFLTTAHSPQDIEKIKAAFRASVDELQEAGFLPRLNGPAPILDAGQPPVANARLGRDKDGRPAWFVPEAGVPGKYIKLET